MRGVAIDEVIPFLGSQREEPVLVRDSREFVN